MNYSVKIDLLKIEGAKVQQAKDGKSYITIPTDAAGLFQGKAGIYANFIAWEKRTSNESGTHYIKQSMPKEQRRDDMPFVGDLKPFGQVGGADNRLPYSDFVEAAKASAPQPKAQTGNDDLPF